MPQVTIDPEAYRRIVNYADFFNQPIDDVVQNAIQFWLQADGEIRLDFAQMKARRAGKTGRTRKNVKEIVNKQRGTLAPAASGAAS